MLAVIVAVVKLSSLAEVTVTQVPGCGPSLVLMSPRRYRSSPMIATCCGIATAPDGDGADHAVYASALASGLGVGARACRLYRGAACSTTGPAWLPAGMPCCPRLPFDAAPAQGRQPQPYLGAAHRRLRAVHPRQPAADHHHELDRRRAGRYDHRAALPISGTRAPTISRSSSSPPASSCRSPNWLSLTVLAWSAQKRSTWEPLQRTRLYPHGRVRRQMVDARRLVVAMLRAWCGFRWPRSR